MSVKITAPYERLSRNDEMQGESRIEEITTPILNEFTEKIVVHETVNVWNEKEILQFAVAATSKSDIEVKLRFLEEYITEVEQKQFSQEHRQRRGESEEEI